MSRLRGDAGVTLIEVLVASSLMSFVGALFTGAFVDMNRVLNVTDAQTVAQQQLSTAIERLDRDIRYASSISVPGTVSGDWYAEYLLDVEGTATCVEVRLQTSTSKLQRRTWVSGSTAVAPWTALASGVQAVGASAPFVQIPSDAVLNYPRLQVVLGTSAGGGTTTASRQSTATWAAVNVVQNDSTVCTEKRGVG